MNEQQKSVPVASWLLPALAHAVILFGMLARLIYSGPRYRKTFADFNMMLPDHTQFVLTLSNWLALYWWVAAVLALGLIAADAFMLWRMGGWRARIGCLWAWSVMGSLLSLWALIELSLLLPLMKLLEGLSRQE